MSGAEKGKSYKTGTLRFMTQLQAGGEKLAYCEMVTPGGPMEFKVDTFILLMSYRTAERHEAQALAMGNAGALTNLIADFARADPDFLTVLAQALLLVYEEQVRSKRGE